MSSGSGPEPTARDSSENASTRADLDTPLSTGARSRTELLCAWALEEGFDRAGVARLHPSEHQQAVRDWVDRGDHAGLGYLTKDLDQRLAFKTRLEGATTALCVALHYPDRDGNENDLWRRVARYAQGDDYHDVMMKRLRRLGDRIESAFPGCRSRSYVDTGPILERELGQRAGLGSIGKNTMLLHPTGSYFLLGEVLLTLELEPSQPLADLCGQCTRCLDACPTDALREPYRLDARRCISYWTIEHRGDFPEGVAELLGGWVFGCDICQEVCPWNSERNPRRLPVEHQELRRPSRREDIEVADLVTMEPGPYLEVFRRSPMKRAKLEGLRRNALLTLSRQLSAEESTVESTEIAEIAEQGEPASESSA